ncbi:hypothetical protein [Desulfoluna sp.]|uniref:hypothetical protein n=1 Tax=Desulfoluna sp. TaxID=2045199 RepID=UPI0026125612|nr:hypothetical protein [Desulfoluna sp.]
MAKTPVDDSVLKPGTGIDLVIKLHSLNPVSYASVIFDSDRKIRQLIVAAPGPACHLNVKNPEPLHVSTLVRMESGEKNRVGFSCQAIKKIPEYRLANGTMTPALVLSYQPGSEEVNVRTAFRYTPTACHEVLGKLIIAGHEFFSGNQFRICDISLTGTGIVIPRLLGKGKNPLSALESGRIARLGIVLRDHGPKKDHIDTLDTAITVVRVNRKFNELSLFAGCRFKQLKSRDEEVLSHFIHKAQLHEIRSLTHT